MAGRSFLLVGGLIVLASIANAADGGSTTAIPTSMAQADSALERMLPQEVLDSIDRMTAPGGMARYHMGLGMAIRNEWELWKGGLLSRRLDTAGIHDPDAMSSAILQAFWHHRHHLAFDLKAYAEDCRRTKAVFDRMWKDQEEAQRKSDTLIGRRMMGVRYERMKPPFVRLPRRRTEGLPTRSLAKFRDGILIGARGPCTFPGEESNETHLFHVQPYFYSLATHRLHRVVVPEIDTIHSFVSMGDTVWYTGWKDHRVVLWRIAGPTRTKLALPSDTALASLGLSDQGILAVYSREAFQLSSQGWMHIGRSKDLLPLSGSPPRLAGGSLILHDEGQGESNKQLWRWRIDSDTLIPLERELTVQGFHESHWNQVNSMIQEPDGSRWITVGAGFSNSLLHFSPSGICSVAVIHGLFRPAAPKVLWRDVPPEITMEAMSREDDGTLWLAGSSGLFHLSGKRLNRVLGFADATQGVQLEDGVLHWLWSPREMLRIGPNAFVIGGLFGGNYLLERKLLGPWKLTAIDDSPTYATIQW
ncbi:MAG: hypothetical protein IPK50_06090 [Fibrobacterota bacterium]|nr:MAG: hypothetical protein IPK50_06090 [Fibrobacterota bacterium]